MYKNFTCIFMPFLLNFLFLQTLVFGNILVIHYWILIVRIYFYHSSICLILITIFDIFSLIMMSLRMFSLQRSYFNYRLREKYQRYTENPSNKQYKLYRILRSIPKSSPHRLATTAFILNYNIFTVFPTLSGKLIIVVIIDGAWGS